ncbi:ATR1 (YML116W) and YMR279C [Zygosaccharomyces parabailii]|uniref:ZYBA0S15-01552g1_1 n=1 Tax=Zygosaccharomyces bailii (strain CLIB 213 / ATCC 58445 / CBS 680 / BCRC 21525 / NBRC 1098 / NCYC 1416 / NRRL Y-2227) TaxID=1333698 RepID=A0A8J2TBP1_ZYGB2|nr:ATR1 (YML116W) and YMR279C [Zygosaccharomyces parabailii]CDF91918.1 ZYBA0S15-01552g1_1 [Zygosaccharomyces bailii CLIB 213]SJM88441.1 probable Drug resistance protein YOR378W [Zygosaccharomyces bailii]
MNSSSTIAAETKEDTKHDAYAGSLEASAENADDEKHYETPKPLIKEIAFIFVVSCAQLMTQAGLAQSIAPLSIIGRSFGAKKPAELSWFPAGYSLTVGTFILIAGRLGDIYGHKKLFVLGFLWYALWSLLAGFSVYSNQIFFDCCRAFQGIGPAFLLPNAIAILGRTYKTGRKKNIVFSLFGATAPGGFVLGATFSSLFAELVWWPWGYWVTAMVCLILAAAGAYLIPHSFPSKQDTNVSLFYRIDVAGSVTGVIGLILINFSWNQAPVVGWQNPYVYIILIVGFVVLGIFTVIERRAKYPLLPLRALSSEVSFVLTCICVGWASFGIWIFYFWEFLEEMRGHSPLLCSAQFVPVAISGFCAALTTGFIMGVAAPSCVMLVAMTAFTVGGILVATAPVNQIYWAQTFVSIIIMPWGMDMSFPSATIMLSDSMPHEHQGLAASLVNTAVNYSISIGLGFAGTVEAHVNDGGSNKLKGYRGAWYLGIGLSGLGIFVAIVQAFKSFSKSRKASQKEITA